MGQPDMLSVKGMSFAFNERVIFENLTFNVKPGEWLLLKGGNGTGKSTVLKLLHKLIPLQVGSISIHSKHLKEYQLEELEEIAPLVNQDPLIAGEMTVIENLLGLEERNKFRMHYLFNSRKRSIAKIEPIYLELAERIGLSAHPHQQAGELSYGQQRLLSLVRALWPTQIRENKLLLVDEPLAGISKENCIKVLDIIEKCRLKGWGILMVEHSPIARIAANKFIDLEEFKPNGTI